MKNANTTDTSAQAPKTHYATHGTPAQKAMLDPENIKRAQAAQVASEAARLGTSAEAPKHTAGPWTIETFRQYGQSFDSTLIRAHGENTDAMNEDNMTVAVLTGRRNPKANAAFIVRAVNSHEELLAALYNLKTWIEADAKGYCAKELRAVSLERHLAVARAAIARAEGRT